METWLLIAFLVVAGGDETKAWLESKGELTARSAAVGVPGTFGTSEECEEVAKDPNTAKRINLGEVRKGGKIAFMCLPGWIVGGK